MSHGRHEYKEKIIIIGFDWQRSTHHDFAYQSTCSTESKSSGRAPPPCPDQSLQLEKSHTETLYDVARVLFAASIAHAPYIKGIKAAIR